ncbi:RNA methyltransferase [Alphaproteobacteria bacterium]|nr:RNA methyltransferase [Alphaproteobacteria bacterium]
MRGYFSIGVERLSKPMNAGNLFRSAHAFGASYVYTIGGSYQANGARSDTSKSVNHIPHYHYDSFEDLTLPVDCILVGIELVDEAKILPSFKHPLKASYLLGPEKGNISDQLLDKCKYIIKIPTKFCVNLAIAGAIVMYDRSISLGNYNIRSLK